MGSTQTSDQSAARLVKQAKPEDLLVNYEYDPNRVQRVAFRKIPQPIQIVEPDPSWPVKFEGLRKRIVDALGDKALCVSHVGSTSIPNMLAKDVIDIDITVADATDEDSYIPALKAAGFDFLAYEPQWHEHRFLVEYEPMANIHVFGEGCVELLRHRLFRDWIIDHPDDKALYEKAKRDAADATLQAGERMYQYNCRKEVIIRQILRRMFKGLGIIKSDEE